MADDQPTTAATRRRRPTSAALTAAVLDPRSGDGWWVLHDCAVPGADHVVVTPSGVWVLASSASPTAPSALEADGLTIGAALVARALATSPVGLLVPVSPLFVATAGPWIADCGVEVAGLGNMLRTLSSAPASCTAEEVTHLAELVDDHFGHRRGEPTSMVRPSPMPPASPDLPVLHPSGRVLAGAQVGPHRAEPRCAADVVVDLRRSRAVAYRCAPVALAVAAVATAVLGGRQLGL